MAGDRSDRFRGAGGGGLALARSGRAAAGSDDIVVVGRRSGAGVAGGPAAESLRRVPARRAHQRPRPRRPRAARGVGAAATGGHDAREPRPSLPRPGRHPRGRARRVHPPHRRVRRGMADVPRRAGARPPTRVAAVRGLRHQAPDARRPRPTRARVGEPGLGSGQAIAGQRTRQEHPRFPQGPDRAARRQGGPNREGDRASRGGGQATRTVAAATRGGRCRPQRSDRGAPDRSHRRTRRASGWDRSTSCSSTASGWRSSATTAVGRPR